MLGVMAEVSCAPVSQCLPRQAFPAAPTLMGTDPIAKGTDSLLQERPRCTGLAWRSPGKREKKGHHWGARWGPLSQVTPPRSERLP